MFKVVSMKFWMQGIQLGTKTRTSCQSLREFSCVDKFQTNVQVFAFLVQSTLQKSFSGDSLALMFKEILTKKLTRCPFFLPGFQTIGKHLVSLHKFLIRSITTFLYGGLLCQLPSMQAAAWPIS